MITYGKKIESLAVYKNLDGKQNYVYKVNWILWGEEGEHGTSIAMYTEIPSVEGDFVPYESLTEGTLLGWVDQYTPAEHIEYAKSNIEVRITEKKTKDVLLPYWLALQYQQEMQQMQEYSAAAAPAQPE